MKRAKTRPCALASAGAGLTFGFLLVLAAAAFAADLLTVVQRETFIRKDKRLMSAKLSPLKEGDLVTRLDEEESWYRVEFKGVEGWLPKSAVSADRKVVLSNEAVASGVRATEQSAGGRGFNPKVEESYRASRTELNAAYAIIDAIQAKKFPEEGVAKFMREGKLGEEVADAGPDAVKPISPWKTR
jgi:hypothetical protein